MEGIDNEYIESLRSLNKTIDIGLVRNRYILDTKTAASIGELERTLLSRSITYFVVTSESFHHLKEHSSLTYASLAAKGHRRTRKDSFSEERIELFDASREAIEEDRRNVDIGYLSETGVSNVFKLHILCVLIIRKFVIGELLQFPLQRVSKPRQR